MLAEIDRTFNLDPHDVEAKITPRTKAIMAVHMTGNPARLKELKAIADARGLFLIEDCARRSARPTTAARSVRSGRSGRSALMSTKPSPRATAE